MLDLQCRNKFLYSQI